MSIAWAEVAGERLEILRIRPERARPCLVFLHEGLGSVAGWRDFPRTLCDLLDAPGLVYSRRGYGRSTPLGRSRATDYLHREAWTVLPALLDDLSIAAPVLVGHSDGGSIALLYAARHEPRAIAIMAPHVFVEEMTVEGIRAAREAWQRGKLQGVARATARRSGRRVLRVERRLARSGLPPLEHRGGVAEDPLSGPGNPGCRRSVRHDGATRPHRGGSALTLSTAEAGRLRPHAAARPARRQSRRLSPNSMTKNGDVSSENENGARRRRLCSSIPARSVDADRHDCALRSE